MVTSEAEKKGEERLLCIWNLNFMQRSSTRMSKNSVTKTAFYEKSNFNDGFEMSWRMADKFELLLTGEFNAARQDNL